jgi:hypothetical protein
MADFNNLNPNLVFDFNRLVPGGLRYASFVLRQDPLMYMRFQETEGPTAFDSSGNSTHGTVTTSGITYGQTSPLTNDKLDTSYAFDGADGFITVPSNGVLNQAFSSFAVDCWLRIDALPALEQTLVSRGSDTGTNNFQLSILPDGRVKYWYSDSSAAKLAYSSTVLTPNTFYYVLGSWDGSTNAVFLNGERGELVDNVVTPASGSAPVQIAAYNNGQRFAGLLDEVALYGNDVDVDTEQRATFNRQGNSPPEIQSTNANGSSSALNIFEGETVSFEILATDVDGDTLQYLFSTDGFIPSIGPQASNIATVQFLETGVFRPVGFVTDGTANRSRPFPVINVDPVPDLVAFNVFDITTYQAAKLIRVLDNDTFPPGGLGSIQAFTQPLRGVVTLQGAGETATLLYTPNLDVQDTEDTFTYTITNGAGATDTALVTVSIAAKRPIQTSTARVVSEPNVTVTFSPQANDRPDPSSQVLTLIDVQTPTSQGGSARIVANQVEYTPATDFLGEDTFVYLVRDEDGLEADGLVQIKLQQRAFEAVSDFVICPFEGAKTFSPLSNDTTPFAETLDVTSITQPPGGEGTAVLNGDNTITYTAPSGYAGTTTFTYTLEDGVRTDTGTITVSVSNFGPRTGIVRVSTPFNTPRIVDPLAVATDPEGEAISLLSFTSPSAGTLTRQENGTAGDLTDDTLLFTPPNGFVGISTFTYTVEDTFGNTRVATAQVAVSYELTINVTPVLLPVTERIQYSASVTAQSGFDKSYEFFWDFGGDGSSTSASGTYQFTGVGIFEVRCTVRDSYGQVETDTVTVEVGANQAPIANDLTVDVAEGQLLNLDPRVNDVEPDNDQFFVADVQATSAQGGFVSLNVGAQVNSVYDDFITYVHPNISTPFVDSFTYTIEDEFGLQDTALITVNVLENQAPVAADVFQPVVFERATVIDVLQNASDPEGDALRIISTTTVPANEGTLTIQGTGVNNTLLFVPDTGYLGVTTFDFTIEDTFSNTDQSQATVSVFGQFYPALVYDDEPLVYYPFNEPSGTRAYDVRPLQWHGQYVNNVDRSQLGPLAKDLENGADVSTGYITLNTGALISQITTALTLELWVALEFGTRIIPGVLEITNNGTTYLWTLTTDDAAKTLVISGLELNEFYHVVLTYDGAWMRAYIEGEIVASTPHTGNVLFPSVLSLGLGMAGRVSDFAIYNKALDALALRAHYLEALGPVDYLELQGPDTVRAGTDFDLTVIARDITGKRVTTDNSTQVALVNDDGLIFDGDNDGNFGEP